MPKLKIDNIQFDCPSGWTILEVAKFFGLEIPSLCYNEGLSPGEGCRLCLVEIGEGEKSKLVNSCSYPVEDGLVVRTASKRVIKARKLNLEKD